MPITQNVFEKFLTPAHMLIETGTDVGNGIRAAMKAGYRSIYSVELNQAQAKTQTEAFKDFDWVTIRQGDSPSVLKEILPLLHAPVTFWLDAHPDHDSPILQELYWMNRCGRCKKHNILIDDRRLMQGHWKSVKEEQVIAALKSINPSYVISYEDGYCENDIIVATISN